MDRQIGSESPLKMNHRSYCPTMTEDECGFITELTDKHEFVLPKRRQLLDACTICSFQRMKDKPEHNTTEELFAASCELLGLTAGHCGKA